MKTYNEIARQYRKRQCDTLVDTIATGLTYVDQIVVESGLVQDTGLLELTQNISMILPFVVIAASEGSKVILKRKTLRNGGKDLATRMLKSGTAIGIGTTLAGVTGVIPAIPVTMAVRSLFDRYKSGILTETRVKERIRRLHDIREAIKAPHQHDDEQGIIHLIKSDILKDKDITYTIE